MIKINTGDSCFGAYINFNGTSFKDLSQKNKRLVLSHIKARMIELLENEDLSDLPQITETLFKNYDTANTDYDEEACEQCGHYGYNFEVILDD